MEGPDAPLKAQVVLLAGPSGSGKSHLAAASGLPVLTLDDFYRDGDDPGLPREPELGIVDWDDPRAWDAECAVATLEAICRTGCADVPEYDISRDRATSTRRFCVDGATAFVAEGLFAAEIVTACRERGILAEAIVLHRPPWKNFTRRLVRDLVERRKPPLTLVRRGRLLMAAEAAVVRRQVALGCRPYDAQRLRRTLAALRARPSGQPSR
ncbi:MAG TPA: uridine kinase [Jiangellales bacterium]|nr:uridine kinase [Jiangellales bacterium]